ncbi:hypothetical protein ACFXJ8_32000 [Nonomuraea sp. NPDC059194]|uniref:hypothetical protein n=1 Tax=Nonomuraea sp. NPDC059194 TaxID=3346764 RepID=UPI00367B8EA1
MTKTVLLTTLVAGALTGPALADAPATLAIKEITIRPGDPVVGPHGSVKLVIDVVASGAEENGVTIKVEPGNPPGPVLDRKPIDGGKVFGPVPAARMAPAAPAAPVAMRVAPPPEEMPPAFAAPRPALPASPGIWGETPAQAALDDAAPGIATLVQAAPSSAPAWEQLPPAPEPEGTPDPAPTPPSDPDASDPDASDPDASDPDGGPIERDGVWETWRFLPAQGLNRFYPAGAWTITATARSADGDSIVAYAAFNLRRDTKLSSLKVSEARGTRGVRLTGALQRVDPSGVADFAPFAKQRLEILYRRTRDAEWLPVATATTGETGRFERRLPGREHGLWRVRFAGTEAYAADQAGTQR